MDPPPSIYRSCQQKDAKQYLDVEVDEVGNISLLHKKLASEVIDISGKQGKQLDEYLKEYFAEKVVHECIVNEVKLDPQYGVSVDCIRDFIKIRRFHYFMATPLWVFEYSKFEASRIGPDENQPRNIHVWHTFNKENFINVCRKVKAFTASNDLTLEDLNLHHQLVMMNRIEIPTPLVQVIPGCDELVEGSYNELPAAIHLFEKNVNISKQFKTILRLNHERHENILGFYGAAMDGCANYRLAFELFKPIETYLKTLDFKFDMVDNNWLRFLRGLVEGLIHLHKLGLAHGNMSRWNVVVTYNYTPKLWELNHCTELSLESRYSDYINLAKLIVFCFSDPPSNISKDCYLKQKLSCRSYNQMHDLAREAKDVVKFLVYDGKNLANLNHVLAHPMLWNCEKRLQFIKEVNDVISSFLVNRAIIDGLDNKCWDIKRGGWHKYFGYELYDYMDAQAKSLKKPNPYDVTSVCSLLRFIRNLYSHYYQIGDCLSSQPCGNYIGSTNETLEYLLRHAFPNLLTCLYNELKRQHVTTLASFYD